MFTKRKSKVRVGPALSVSGVTRWLIYKPLVVLLAVLVAPVLSWMQGGGPAVPHPFQANAQGAQGCTSTSNTIIQTYCVNGILYGPDLIQFESDAVSTYLSIHSLPATAAPLIYSTGREDLRNQIRGVMLNLLQSIILTPASRRSTHDQNLYNWLQTLVQQNEITEYTQALNNFSSFQGDPCNYTLDPQIAAQYKLSYDGTPWCFSRLESSIFPPPVPAGSYYIAYGLKQSYEAPAASYYYFPSIVAGSTVGQGETALVVEGASSLLAAQAAGFIVFQGFLQQSVLIAADVVNAIGSMETAQELCTVISSAIAPILNFAIFAGPVGILLECIAADIQAGMELYSNQQNLAVLNNISNSLAQAQSTPPDLTTFVNDPVGALKLNMTLASQTLPDVPSTAPLPAHQTTDLNFAISPSAGGSTTVATTLSYTDWSQNIWSAQTSGGWFVETCTAGANSTGPCPATTSTTSDSLTASLQYVDWSGVNWIASRIGTTFVSVQADPASTAVPCPANAVTGVSPGTNFSNCQSYVSNSIPLTDGSGNHVTVSLSALAPPAFTSSTTLAFGPSVPSTATITVSGNPTPDVCVTSSNLPADFTAALGSCQTGGFQLPFDGSPNAPQGNYSLTLAAASLAGFVSQTFSINVSPQLAIISANSMNATVGLPASFTVVATGNPTPALTTNLSLNGLSFTDNKNGTATIGGIYSSELVIGNCTSAYEVCGNITASSSQGTVVQPFTINLTAPPPAVIPGCPPYSGDPTINQCPGTTFTVGAPSQVLLTTTGEATNVTWSLSGWSPSQVPSWLTLQDNGNGTATLSGTPPPGTNGTVTAQITTTATYALPQNSLYPISFSTAPVFTSPSMATFTVGGAAQFPVSADAGTISLNGTLPAGLSFSSPGNPATISGTPAAGTGGQYTIPMTDNAGTAGSVTESLILDVNEGPQITSANTATMLVGTAGMFAVTTTGFPSVSSHAVPPNSPPPTGPSQGDGMYFTVAGLPADLSATNVDALGFAGSTLTIQGTPSAGDAGAHQVYITAQNGVGQTATQTLTLDIVKVTGAAPVSGGRCNGAYTGTFNGTLVVSAGQNCAFYGGGISGNVAVKGGTLTLSNATVTGSMSIQGGAAFSIGAGTTIDGNLSIKNVGSGTATGQICAATLNGNLTVSHNAIPITIGSPETYCYGNNLGGYVEMLDNTAPVSVYANSITKYLACQSNTSIKGGENTAKQKLGQCAAF